MNWFLIFGKNIAKNGSLIQIWSKKQLNQSYILAVYNPMNIKSSIILGIMSRRGEYNRQNNGNCWKKNAQVYEHNGLTLTSILYAHSNHFDGNICIANTQPVYQKFSVSLISFLS